jgi:hypothetical protein
MFDLATSPAIQALRRLSGGETTGDPGPGHRSPAEAYYANPSPNQQRFGPFGGLPAPGGWDRFLEQLYANTGPFEEGSPVRVQGMNRKGKV